MTSIAVVSPCPGSDPSSGGGEANRVPAIAWHSAPLRDVEFWSLRIRAAAIALAIRYAAERRTSTGAEPSARHRKALAVAWLTGWDNDVDRWARRYNWMRPLAHAYRDGRAKRRELEVLLGS